jgi:4-amino-4-deoxy-L-arabinose transferase-like glycosyltransferase
MAATDETRRRWGTGWDLALLVAFVLAVFGSRLTTLPLRGEESRWARVAIEMIQTGDWVVPRQQGEPFLSRPPLGHWMIAAAALAVGDCSPLAVRLPTLLATLATTLLVYAYARNFLSRSGALAAGLVYATFGSVLQLGRLAETEASFTVFLAGSLLVWHWAYVRGRSSPWGWVAGYALAALAALTKGPQAPVYFAGGVGAYLLLVRRDVKTLFSLSHAFGLLTFAALVAAWQIPCMLALDTRSIWALWSADVTSRLGGSGIGATLRRALTFNSAIVASLLPWSLLLFDYVRPSLRRSLGEAKACVAFWATCLVVTLPTCWIVQDGQSRYYMPMFPGVAVLVGVVIDRALAAEPGDVGRWLWDHFQGAIAIAAVGLAVVIGVAGRVSLPLPPELRQPAWAVAAYALAMAGAAWVLWRARGARGVETRRWGAVAAAAVLGVTFAGPVLSMMARKSEDTRTAVARVKALLPPGTKLVSFDSVHHLFAYYYRDPIEYRPLSNEGIMPGPDKSYFVVGRCDAAYKPLPLPYPWETVAVVSCERNQQPHPMHVVVVGRRLGPAEIAARAAQAPAKGSVVR